MAFTNTLKPTIDVPVWEWLRQSPISCSSDSCSDSSTFAGKRYLYEFNNSSIYRYDTQTDGWQILKTGFPSSNLASATNTGLKVRNRDGYWGYAISATSSSIECAAQDGQLLVGYKIRIYDGKGAGQERTIVAANENNIVRQRVVVSTINNSTTTTLAITDANAKWRLNQWRNYQCRFILGTGASTTSTRTILYNNQSTLFLADVRAFAQWPQIYSGFLTGDSTTVPIAGTVGNIESSILQINTPWVVVPDYTSKFIVFSGTLMVQAWSNSTPSLILNAYDVASDVFYYRKVFNNGAYGSFDPNIDSMDWDGTKVYFTGSISAYTTRSIVVNGGSASMIPNQFVNYRVLLDNGCEDIVHSNTTSSITTRADFFYTGSRPGETTDNCIVVPDYDKIWVSQGGDRAGLNQYSRLTDSWQGGVKYDGGILNNMGVRLAGTYVNAVFPIIQMTSSANTASFQTAYPHNFKDGDIITITGATGSDASTFNILSGVFTGSNIETNMTGSILGPVSGSFIMSASPAVTRAGFYSGSISMVVDSTKNWKVNEHAGRILAIWDGTTPFAYNSNQSRIIASNDATTLTLNAAFTTNPMSNQVWAYTIHDVRPFGSSYGIAGNLGPSGSVLTGSIYLTGSTVTGQTYLYNASPLFSENSESFVPGLPITGSGIPSGSLIRGVDWYRLPVSMSLNQTASATGTAIYTCSYDSAYGFGIVTTSGGSTTITDSTKAWVVNQWVGAHYRHNTLAVGGSLVTTTISSNTSNTLNLGASLGTMNTSSAYGIIAIQSRAQATGGYFLCCYGGRNTGSAGKYIYSPRGASTPTWDRYNIATDTWEWVSPTPIQNEVLSLGTMYAYDGDDKIYFTKDATGKIFVFDIDTHRISQFSQVPYGMGTAIRGNRMSIVTTNDGLKYLYVFRHSATEVWRCLLNPITESSI